MYRPGGSKRLDGRGGPQRQRGCRVTVIGAPGDKGHYPVKDSFVVGVKICKRD